MTIGLHRWNIEAVWTLEWSMVFIQKRTISSSVDTCPERMNETGCRTSFVNFTPSSV